MLSSPSMRRVARVAWDCMSWFVATLLVVGSRYDFELNQTQWSTIVLYAGCAAILQISFGTMLMIYRGRHRLASFDESVGLASSALLSAGVLAIAFLLLVDPSIFPRALAILAPPVAFLFMAAARWAYRGWKTRRGSSTVDAERVLIYGAGDAGYQLACLIRSDSDSRYKVVGFIDDARSKRNLRMLGAPVLGGRSVLAEVAAKRDAQTVILAITHATAEFVQIVSDEAARAGLRFRVLPPVSEQISGRVRLSDIREVDIADVLGRHQIETNLNEIAGYLTGRRVLITGAGGSIGSELARQVYRFGPKELVLLDRDESALHAVQLSIYGQGLLDSSDMVLADIRDMPALDAVFETHRPEVVFHAAALKHLPMLERYPEEGWKTNVIGSLHVLTAARKYGCTRFVNISTDKAATPTSILGHTKRAAEQLTAWFARRSAGTYLSVRFGNVLGSRGSMLHTFSAQIARGGPVTVTHPEVTRFFMTIPEACQLTIQAAAIGEPGEVLVLDMGEPVKILDVAHRLIAQAGSGIDVVFTGLRPGEKMHEILLSEDERGEFREHPLISHVCVPPLDPEGLERVHHTMLESARTGGRVPVSV